MKEQLRALSIREPHASLIADGKKRIENRSWGINVRGDIAVHRCGKDGAIVGVMHISDVLPMGEALKRYPDQAEYISGPLCWVIESFTPCAPLPCVGRLSLWLCPQI